MLFFARNFVDLAGRKIAEHGKARHHEGDNERRRDAETAAWTGLLSEHVLSVFGENEKLVGRFSIKMAR